MSHEARPSAFELGRVPLVVSGAGTARSIGARLQPFLAHIAHKKVLIVKSRSAPAGDVVAALSPFCEIAIEAVHGEPEASQVDALWQRFRRPNVRPAVIIAVGGGSTIDTAKACAAMLGEHSGEQVEFPQGIAHFLEKVGDRKPSGRTLPLFVCPTTAGTGSECTMNAVISGKTAAGKAFKASLRHERFVPSCAILDPELGYEVPAEAYFAAALDSLTQLVEAHASRKSSPASEAFSAQGLRNFGKAFRILLSDGLDSRSNSATIARSELLWAASCSGVALAHAGLGTVHGLAGALGAHSGIAHGSICAKLLPEVCSRTVDALRRSDSDGMRRYEDIAQLLDTSGVDDFLSLLRDWSTVAAPISSVGSAVLDAAVDDSDNKNNIVQFQKTELREILGSVFQ